MSFCDKYGFEDGDYVNADKLIWYPGGYAHAEGEEGPNAGRPPEGRGRGPRREGYDCGRGHRRVLPAWHLGPNEEEAEGRPLKHSTVEVWASVVIDLYNIHIAKGQHSNPHPRGFAVRSPKGRPIQGLKEDPAAA